MTEAQIDWCLKMEAKDSPGTLVFHRGGQPVDPPGTRGWIKTEKAWADVLRGAALATRQGDEAMAPVRAAIERMRAEGKLGAAGVGGLVPQVVARQPPGKPSA